MAGVGKLLKQAQKMQKQVESAQAALENEVLDVTCGGGAISLRINGQGVFQSISLDPEFLKEDKALIEETLLEALREASQRAKEFGEEALSKATGGFNFPGFPGL
jgi:hypothetical protein